MKQHWKRVISAVLAIGLAMSMTACSGNSGSTSQEPKGTGDKVDFPWENMLLLPGLMYRTLFLAQTDLSTLEPDLASEYSVSEDGLTYTIQFKDGSKWSDGEPITVNDVLFSIKTNLKAAVSNGIFTTAFGKIEGAEAWRNGEADDLAGLSAEGNTITIKLSSPHSAFMKVLAQFAILPEHCLADVDPLELNTNDFWSNPVTSGMYRLDEMKAGSYYTLVRNENYDGVQPKIEKIINYFVSD